MPRKLTLKSFCANCVMVAGAVTSIAGAAKSIGEMIPTSCLANKKMAGPVVSMEEVQVKSAPAPAPPPPPPSIAGREENRGGPAAPGAPVRDRTLESRAEPPPKIVYYKTELKKDRSLFWLGPLALAVGLAMLVWGRKLKRREEGNP